MGLFWSNSTQKDDNLETYSLIWLDAEVNNSKENLQAQQQLRTSINHLRTFEDDQQCLAYISTFSKEDRIILIVSGRFGQTVVPKITHLPQIISIYVYCMNKEHHEKWAQGFVKIRGVLVRLDELIRQIQVDQVQRQRNKADEALQINKFITDQSNFGRSSTEINGQFIYSQLLIDCLLRMQSITNDEKQEFVALCRQQYKANDDELKVVTEFERKYSPDCSIFWYTKDTFLYKLLNKALRVQNVDLLYLFRFFITDLEQQLEKNRCSSSIRVYRRQQMAKEEITILQKCEGEYVSFNSFLSTSLELQEANVFLSAPDSNLDLERVLFQIDADPKLENIKPFSKIAPFSEYPGEKEVLFMIGSIFQLHQIRKDSNEIWNIQMTLCSANDLQSQELFQHMKAELDHGGTTPLRFGHILRRMGKLNDAEKYYHRYLRQLPHQHPHISDCYNALGKLADAKSDYDKSLEWYNKSLEIDLQNSNLDRSNIAAAYNSIGIAYSKKGDYVRALDSYEEALLIRREIYGDDSIQVAECLNNKAGIYFYEKDYVKALELHQQILAIRCRCLPPNHPQLGSSYDNMASIHRCLGRYAEALKDYELSLNIKSKCLPSEHPDIAMTLENLGLVYEDMKNFPQAQIQFDEAAKIYRRN